MEASATNVKEKEGFLASNTFPGQPILEESMNERYYLWSGRNAFRLVRGNGHFRKLCQHERAVLMPNHILLPCDDALWSTYDIHRGGFSFLFRHTDGSQ